MPNIDVSHYQVIDGQQRLTTLLLLLRALREFLDRPTEHVTERKINQLLFNVNEREDKKSYHKLILTEDDDKTLKEIMRDGRSDSSNSITTNFKYLVSCLRRDDIDPDIIWRGIRGLTMVQILIDKNDNAQAIFESMNSTGLDLSETDMIQNYLLMSEQLESQKRIYCEYWRPMEKRFGEERSEHFEDFIRNYLAMHRGKIVSKKEMYEYFKTHMTNRNKKEEIEKMYKYSQHYADLINISEHTSDRIRKVIKHINDQDTNVANSLLLKLLADHAYGIISEEECERAFILVDSYLFRCYICDMTKGGNKVFPEIIPKISKSDYVKSIERALMSKSGNRKFPRDVTFRDNLERIALYNNRTICKYMLVRLEDEKSRESLDPVNLSIEHIMPQTLTDEWKGVLGQNWKELHEKYLDILGNLTLTGYNQTLGNDSFSHKRDIYQNSNVMLNRELAEQHSSWNENSIKKRTCALAEQAVKIWKCPAGYDSDGQYPRTSEAYESEYLEGKESVELWDRLKEKIQASCAGVTFRMRKHYGAFRLPTGSNGVGICSLEARRNKINLTYNTRLRDEIIEPSRFVRDVSAIGHYGPGDMQSTIMTEDDIDRAVKLVKTIYDSKSGNP